MKFKKILSSKILALLLVVFVAGCGGSGGGSSHRGNGANGAFAKLDITDATALVIAPSSAVKASSVFRASAETTTTTNTLFKVTSDGALKIVNILDNQGNVLSSQTYNPTNIINIDNTQYFIIAFSNESYLVRKTDGAVFSLANVGDPADLNDEKVVKTDGNGNLYYIVWAQNSGDIVKINIQNPQALTKTTIAQSVYMYGCFMHFSPDKDGNVAYLYTDTVNYVDQPEITLSNGGLYDSFRYLSSKIFWTGLDGNLYIQESDGIKKITIDASGNINKEAYGPNNNLTIAGKIIELGDKMFSVKTGYGIGVVQLYGVNAPRRVSSVENLFSSAKLVVASKNYYYISGNDKSSGQPVLYKINPNGDSSQELLHGYDVYKMTVSDNDELTFNALDMNSPGQPKVLGKVAFGTVTIIDRSLNTEVVKLERIQ